MVTHTQYGESAKWLKADGRRLSIEQRHEEIAAARDSAPRGLEPRATETEAAKNLLAPPITGTRGA